MITYHDIAKARDECNSNKVGVILKAKEKMTKSFEPRIDPNHLFNTTRQTLKCMFPISLPLFGTVLSADDI